MNAHKSRDDHQAKRSGQAGRLGLKSKKRVRFQTDEQQVENNEEEAKMFLVIFSLQLVGMEVTCEAQIVC